MDIDKTLEKYKLATTELLKGNAETYKTMFSHRDDVTLSNPFFPTVRGWDKVSETLDLTAERLRDGEVINSIAVSKYVTPELAYVVSLAHEKAKIGGSQDITPVDLRATMILRPEDGTWKIVHLHGEIVHFHGGPITTPRPPESVIPK